MSGGTILVSSLLSLLWIAVAIQDIRVGKLDNVATVSAFALAFGYRVGGEVGCRYFVSLVVCTAAVVLLFASNLLRGGDAKLLLSLLAWQPTVETWAIALVCLAVIGGAVVAWSRLRRKREQNDPERPKCPPTSCRYPLGGVAALAGLVVLWTRAL